MQAYLTVGSEKHLHAAKNGFDMLMAQSFATGGWGPDERLRATDSPEVAASLANTHSSFKTPCGAYAHFKLTRYLLRVFRDPQYGDSMEKVMYNTILGQSPYNRTEGPSIIPTTTSKGKRFIQTIAGPAARVHSRRSPPITESTRIFATRRVCL